jgi:hypothetical protein
VTDDNFARTLSIIWKKATVMPLTVWVGEAGECFFFILFHTRSIAPAYRYDVTVGDRKTDHFGE